MKGNWKSYASKVFHFVTIPSWHPVCVPVPVVFIQHAEVKAKGEALPKVQQSTAQKPKIAAYYFNQYFFMVGQN